MTEAAARLLREYPDAHVFFGATRQTFESALAVWDVFEDSECWVMLEGTGSERTLHWFCPKGASLPALRRIFAYVFRDLGIESLSGDTAKGHPYYRESRALAIALGMENVGERHVLTYPRFLAYNRGKVGFPGGSAWAAL